MEGGGAGSLTLCGVDGDSNFQGLSGLWPAVLRKPAAGCSRGRLRRPQRREGWGDAAETFHCPSKGPG